MRSCFSILIVLACLNAGAVYGVDAGHAVTCGGSKVSQYTVSYGCGDGTQKSGVTLPDSVTVTWGQAFSPTSIGSSHCTPPAGYVNNAGLEIWIDGEKKVVANSTYVADMGWTYMYDSDITITPHYAPLASAIDMINHVDVGGYYYETNWSTWGWTAYFTYGYYRGVAMCSNTLGGNGAAYAGYVPPQQVQLSAEYADTGKSNTGVCCYCKLTEPSYSKSPWVSGGCYTSESGCAGECPARCGWMAQDSQVWRGAVTVGVEL